MTESLNHPDAFQVFRYRCDECGKATFVHNQRNSEAPPCFFCDGCGGPSFQRLADKSYLARIEDLSPDVEYAIVPGTAEDAVKKLERRKRNAVSETRDPDDGEFVAAEYDKEIELVKSDWHSIFQPGYPALKERDA